MKINYTNQINVNNLVKFKGAPESTFPRNFMTSQVNTEQQKKYNPTSEILNTLLGATALGIAVFLLPIVKPKNAIEWIATVVGGIVLIETGIKALTKSFSPNSDKQQIDTSKNNKINSFI